MPRQHRAALGCFGALTLILTCPLGASAGPQSGSEASAPISVHLAPTKRVWNIGEAISIEVKIVNRGTRAVFIGRDLDTVGNGVSRLSLSVQDSHGQPSEGFGWAGDSVPDSKETFASYLARNWVVLEPGYFYGAVIQIVTGWYPLLAQSGHYHICGVFESKGLTAPLYFNVLSRHPDEVKQLPYDAWEGEVKTNCVEVSIVPGSKQGKHDK